MRTIAALCSLVPLLGLGGCGQQFGTPEIVVEGDQVTPTEPARFATAVEDAGETGYEVHLALEG